MKPREDISLSHFFLRPIFFNMGIQYPVHQKINSIYTYLAVLPYEIGNISSAMLYFLRLREHPQECADGE